MTDDDIWQSLLRFDREILKPRLDEQRQEIVREISLRLKAFVEDLDRRHPSRHIASRD